MTKDSKESVLTRWSRRKQEATLPTAVVEEVVSQDSGVTPAATAQAEAVPESEPVLTDADMPDIETLTEDSDFSGFMSAGVSDELRNLALRKLFQAPVFNIRDGLDEYDGDYTYFEKLGDIVTCDMKHQIEMQEQKLREALEQESESEAEQDVDADLEEIEDVEDETEAEELIETVAESEPETRPKQELDNEQ